MGAVAIDSFLKYKHKTDKGRRVEDNSFITFMRGREREIIFIIIKFIQSFEREREKRRTSARACAYSLLLN
jgi:hypothetical protein